MIPIDKAIAGLQALKERGATHCEVDDEIISAIAPDEEQITYHPVSIGYVDEHGAHIYGRKIDLRGRSYLEIVDIELG